MANQTTKKTPDVEIEKYVDMQTKFEAYTGKEPYLFVSYSHRDTAKVYPILDALYDRKYRLWYDESCETGNDFRDELRERIKGSEAVLLFVSESSMSSPFCGMEIIVARENGKRFKFCLPILITVRRTIWINLSNRWFVICRQLLWIV